MEFEQREFSFDPTDQADGLQSWRAEREQTIQTLCRKLGLPIGHQTEVVLAQGPVLRGRLRLARNELWIEGSRHTLELEIDGTPFRLGDVETVVRLE